MRRNIKQIEDDILTQTKVCSFCNQRKPFSRFYSDKRKRDGRRSVCTVCDTKIRLNDYIINKNTPKTKVSKKGSRLRYSYGLSLDEYRRLLERQKHSCAICGVPTTTLVVDHCHNTGVIRGLLCNDCNRAIGLLKDSAALLKKASEYLKYCRTSTKIPNIKLNRERKRKHGTRNCQCQTGERDSSEV